MSKERDQKSDNYLERKNKLFFKAKYQTRTQFLKVRMIAISINSKTTKIRWWCSRSNTKRLREVPTNISAWRKIISLHVTHYINSRGQRLLSRVDKKIFGNVFTTELWHINVQSILIRALWSLHFIFSLGPSIQKPIRICLS